MTVARAKIEGYDVGRAREFASKCHVDATLWNPFRGSVSVQGSRPRRARQQGRQE